MSSHTDTTRTRTWQGTWQGTALRLLVLVVSAALLLTHRAPTAAHADEPSESTVLVGTSIVINAGFELTGTVGGLVDSVPIGSCMPIGSSSSTQGASQLCFGSVRSDSNPITITGLDGTIFESASGAANALGWIQKEAEQYLAATYQVAADTRLSTYARSEIRAYVLMRLMDIVDRAVYGVELTSDEQKALTYIQGRVAAENSEIASYALAEYDKWKKLDCAYSPPSAPTYVTSPVKLSQTFVDSCELRLASPISTSINLGTQSPSVSDFRTWGSYRFAHKNLAVLEIPAAQQTLIQSTASFVALGAMGVAVGGALAAGLFVGSSTALATAAAAMMGSFAVSASAAAGTASFQAAMAAAVPAVGAGAAAAVVGVVLLAAVVIAVSAIHFQQRDQVGQQLQASVDAAKAVTDPFRISEQLSTYAGLDFQENLTTNRPYHRTEASGISQALMRIVGIDTMTNYVGGFNADPTGTFDEDNSHRGDFEFRTIITGTQPVMSDTVRIQAGDGTWQDLSFEDYWPQVTPVGGQTEARLTFDIKDPDTGERMMVSRAPGADLKWLVSSYDTAGGVDGDVVDAVKVITEDGARWLFLEPAPEDPVVSGMLPVAIGMTMPGRTMGFKPNPIDQNGYFDHATFSGPGYTYNWLIQKVDSDGSLTTEATTTGYAPTFVPDEPGRYVAVVTMTHNGSSPMSASVPFTVDTPAIEDHTITLGDTGTKLSVSIEAAERAGSDSFTAEITWPRAGDGVAPTTVVDQIGCYAHLPDGCFLGTTSAQDQMMTHTLDELAHIEDPVTVKLTNRWGSTVTKELWIGTDVRPRIEAPLASLDNSVTASHRDQVSFSGRTAYVQIPVLEGVNVQVASVTSSLPPGSENEYLLLWDDELSAWKGTTVGLLPTDDQGGGMYTLTVGERDTATGRRPLMLWGTTKAHELGTHRVRVPVFDGHGYSNLEVVIDVVPELNDMNRAWLFMDEDSDGTDPARAVPGLLGGTTENPYTGDYCMKMQSMVDGATSQTVCRPIDQMPVDPVSGLPRLPLSDMLPEGMKNHKYKVSVWLPESDQALGRVTLVDFVYQTLGAPTVGDLAWDNQNSVVTVPVTTADGSISVDRSQCWLDGEELDTCVTDAEPTLNLPGLDLGQHTLRVLVTDSTGNYQRRDQTFTVSEIPLGKATFQVKVSKKKVKAGTKVRVKVSGLAPGERFSIRLGSKTLVKKATASAAGKINRLVKVPTSMRAGTYAVKVIGSKSNRKGSTKIVVTVPKKRR